MKKSFPYILFTLAVLTAYVLSACGASTPAAAPAVQQPASSDSSANVPTILDVQVAFSGVVESMNGDQWVVDGKAVTVLPQAVADNIQVGDVVKVEATVGQDGRINTTRVQNSMIAGVAVADATSDPASTQTPPPATSGGQEVFGVIEAMTDTTVTIGGVVYQLANFSEVKGLLSVGDEVKIHFVTNPDGSLTIREIELRSSGNDNSNDNGNGTSMTMPMTTVTATMTQPTTIPMSTIMATPTMTTAMATITVMTTPTSTTTPMMIMAMTMSMTTVEMTMTMAAAMTMAATTMGMTTIKQAWPRRSAGPSGRG